MIGEPEAGAGHWVQDGEPGTMAPSAAFGM
jgi:hypothetical protein